MAYPLNAERLRQDELQAPAKELGFTASDVCLSLGGRRILTGISARFEPDRIYGLIGPNGSGKTSLMRILARQGTPSAGAVRFGGRPLSEWPARAFAREVAYVPQQLPISQQLTVRELVGLGRYPWHGPFRRPTPRDREAVEAALSITGVETLADRLVDTLSGGERQRAWVSMMVAQAGRFLILDEPTSALDLAHQAHLLELLRAAARARGLGIIMSFHDINIAARFCDEVLAMKAGALVASGSPDEIVRAEVLSHLYDIEMSTLPHPETRRPIGFIR